MALHTIVEHDTTHIKPYIDNVKQALSDEVNVRSVLGAHQFLDYDLTKLKALNAGGTWASNKYSLNSVEITVNDDNSLIFSTDANGATGVVDFTINNRIYLEDGTYTLDVDVTTFDSYTYTRVMGWNGSSWVELANRPKNFTASGTYQYYQLVIRLLAGATFNPSKTYKPLIKLASDSSNAFTSYAMTNKELTDVVKDLQTSTKIGYELPTLTSLFTSYNEHISSIPYRHIYKMGRFINITMFLTIDSTGIGSWTQLGILKPEYRPYTGTGVGITTSNDVTGTATIDSATGALSANIAAAPSKNMSFSFTYVVNE